jgi:hypothetical protein
MEGGKEEKNLIKGPLTDPIDLQEDSLKEEDEKANSDHLSRNHHKKVRPIRHLSHQSNLYKKYE